MSDIRFKKGDKVRLKETPGRPSPVGFSFLKDYEVQDTTRASVKLKNDDGDMRWLFDHRLEPAPPEIAGTSVTTVWVDELASIPLDARLERLHSGDWVRRVAGPSINSQVTNGRSYLIRGTRWTVHSSGSRVFEVSIQDDNGRRIWDDACYFELDMRPGDEESRLTPKPASETKIKGWGAWA